MMLPMLAASDWGIAVAIVFLFILFLFVGFVIIQGTRAQLYWRKLVEQGDVGAIQALASEEINRWRTARTPRGVAPEVWHGVQSADLIEVKPDAVRVSALAEGQYALVSGERREVSSALNEGIKLTARLAEMLMYDIPNVKLPYAQIDIYSTYRDERGSSQQCIISTVCKREISDALDWDDMSPDEIVLAFAGRYSLDDRGNALPINPDAVGPSGVPSVFYKDD